jgi:hypothetical protein
MTNLGNVGASRKAVKAYLKTNLPAIFPTPLTKLTDALFDPTVSVKPEGLIQLRENDFDEYHVTVGLDLHLSLPNQDEDDVVQAIAEFFDSRKTLGGAVVLAELKSVDLFRDMSRPGYLYVQASAEVTL